MRVDLNGSAAAAEAFGQATKTSSNNKLAGASSTGSATVDTTSLSASSGAVKTLSDQAALVFPTRAEKVAALQQKVASGQYELDADRTALALTQADI